MNIRKICHSVVIALVVLSIVPTESTTISAKQQPRLKKNRKINKTKKVISPRSTIHHNDTKDKKLPVTKSLRMNCIDKKEDIVDGLCNNAINYPTELVQKQVKSMKKEFKHFPGVAVRPYQPSNIFMTRSSLGEEDSNMCYTRTLTYFPKMARNTNELWRRIIQDENFVQQVTLIKCLHEYKQCRMQEAIPEQYKTVCKHQMITVRLVALDEHLKWIVEDFPIPGGCACFIKGRLHP